MMEKQISYLMSDFEIDLRIKIIEFLKREYLYLNNSFEKVIKKYYEENKVENIGWFRKKERIIPRDIFFDYRFHVKHHCFYCRTNEDFNLKKRNMNIIIKIFEHSLKSPIHSFNLTISQSDILSEALQSI